MLVRGLALLGAALGSLWLIGWAHRKGFQRGWDSHEYVAAAQTAAMLEASHRIQQFRAREKDLRN